MDKKTIDLFLKKAYQGFSKKIEPTKIKKIIPLAFPVLQSTWKTKIATTESIGLIDRYILRVLKEFGPCDIQKIDKLLCLGEDRIKHALIEMEKLGSPITHVANEYSFAIDGDIEHYHIEQEHDFAFCINGISGDLLPIDFCKKSSNIEINDIGEGHSLYIKLPSIISGLESKLLSIRSGADALRFHEGIPDGFVCLTEKKPRNEFCRFFLAFAVVTIDGAITVFCAGDNSISLNSPENYLERIPEFNYILVKKDVIDTHLTGLSVMQDRNTVCIKVNDQTLWNCFAIDEPSNQAIFLMRDFIKNGWLWDIFDWKFSHYILLPADAKTATALFICKASFELEHSAYINLDTRYDAENWLQDYFNSLNYSMISCPKLDEILKTLHGSLNSEVRDFVRMMSKQKGDNIIQHRFNKVFYNSTEKNWRDCITDCFKMAKKSIKIVSPVVESELVFKELQEARQRGVDLQIITSLLDRNGKIKASDKQFSSMQISGQKLASLGASVRATKNIPHAKLLIIDNSIVLFMSANLNDNSLGLGNINAVETCIILQESDIASKCIQLFDGIWESGQFFLGINPNSTFIAQTAGKPLSELPDSLEGPDETLIFSWPNNLALEKTIAKIIKDAKSEVILMAMSFYDMEKVPELYNIMLEGLLSQKISIKLLVRSGVEQFGRSEWPDESTKHLMAAGMQIIEIPHLHAKGVIVDSRSVLAMSANFNPYSLGNMPTSHIEMGILTNSKNIWGKQFIAFTRKLINTSI